MKHSFVAYIDESGDEGYQFADLPAKKSSEWFIMSAAVCDMASDKNLHKHMAWFEKCRAGKRRPFHFRGAHHHERIAFMQNWRLGPFTFITVFAHKPSILPTAALRTTKHWLFNYATKLLVERISWYCAERTPLSGNGKAMLIFSERGQLKLERITNYLAYLQSLTHLYGNTAVPREAKNSIKWQAIDLNLIEIQPHDSLIGLQVADGVASGCAAAVEFSSYSTTEHRFMKLMLMRFYRRHGHCQSYGIKFIPNVPDDDPFGPTRMHWLKHFK